MSWVFDKLPSREISRVFIHCSDSDIPGHDNIETIRRWHTDPQPRGNGWKDVGYHFFIRKSGLIEKGRHPDVVPAAQAGHNAHSIAICLSGRKEFTEAQFEALRDICEQVHSMLPLVTFHGHREVAPHKTCPNFDYRKEVGLDARGALI